MSSEPILLFLHGVGDGDHDDIWKQHLEQSLIRSGYPGLAAVQVVAPKYAHALKGWDEEVPLPGVTLKKLPRDAARQNRRDFEHRTGAIEFRLGRHNHGTGWIGGDAVVGAAVQFPFAFRQVRNYLSEKQIRAQVLDLILAKLPKTGRVVIVGHSLGSVITADLVPRLPVGLEVVGLVTIGSPLANGSFDVDNLKGVLKEPPTNVTWWVNFWNPADFVAAHRGVSSVFPWMVDLRIGTKKIGLQAHAAAEYLSNGVVATAIGFALFGSLSTELAAINTDLEIALDTTETFALLALRYAHLTLANLDGDQRDRYAGALRQVQAVAIDDLQRRNERAGRAVPSAVARLAFDLSDPRAAVPKAMPSRYSGKDEAVILLTTLATSNVIRPFEITITKKDAQQEAMKELTAEMGLGTTYGADVFAAVKSAQEALGGGRGVNWVKWGAIGVGAAALVVATGGLALAAAPGVAGAAVITSALASFGPGGMIGGLLTAGSLVGAGGGGIALGLASSGTTAETLEAVVLGQLAATILRERQNLTPDMTVWQTLVEIELEVRRKYEQLDEFSDETSLALKELKHKISVVGRALKYLHDNGLEPNVSLSDEEATV